MSDDLKLPIPIFNSTNYNMWKSRLIVIMEAWGLADHLTGSPASSSKQPEKVRKHAAAACAIFISGLSDLVYQQVLSLSTVHDMLHVLDS